MRQFSILLIVSVLISFKIDNGNKIDGGIPSVLTPQIAGHNLINKLGLIKFGNYEKRTKKFYT